MKTALAAAGAATVGGALLGAGTGMAAKGGKGGGGGGGGGGGAGSARNPLYVPPVVSPGNFAITAAPSQVDIGGGQMTSCLAYNDGMPGPTFQTVTGGSADVLFTNGLPDETTIHWHGMIVTEAADGHPSAAVLPGENYSYKYPIAQRACMNWYHPHPHTKTGPQVAYGLAGGFIIRDAEEAALGLPSGAYEVPLVIRDAKFDAQGNLDFRNSKSGFLGNVPLVNGTIDPKLDVETAVYRFRILIGSNARIFTLAFSDGTPFTLIGNDGGLLENSVDLAEITGSSGERFDVLVDLRDRLVGDSLMLQDIGAGWDILELNVAAASSNPGSLPTRQLSVIEKLADPVMTREFGFDGMTSINGQKCEMARVDFQVPRGQTELWRFTTGGNAPHPIHIHGASYQIVSRTGGRNQLFPWEAGWKDVVLLDDGETIEILIRFNDHAADGFRYPSTYVMHCHKLSHEDAGMMLNFQVV